MDGRLTDPVRFAYELTRRPVPAVDASETEQATAKTATLEVRTPWARP
ncbi:hypothetical protein [Streptomyces sp. NPDC050548]